MLVCMDKPFENQSVSAISIDLYEISYSQPLPATFTFVMRAFSTLEGREGFRQNLTLWSNDPLRYRIMTNGNGSEGNKLPQ